jgi:hypothetical protein
MLDFGAVIVPRAVPVATAEHLKERIVPKRILLRSAYAPRRPDRHHGGRNPLECVCVGLRWLNAIAYGCARIRRLGGARSAANLDCAKNHCQGQ